MNAAYRDFHAEEDNNNFINNSINLDDSIAVSQQAVEEVVEEEDHSSRSCFQVTAQFRPSGDQPEAIEQLVKQLEEGDKYSVLRGITGTGKVRILHQKFVCFHWEIR